LVFKITNRRSELQNLEVKTSLHYRMKHKNLQKCICSSNFWQSYIKLLS